MLGASLTARIAAAYRARASGRDNAICADPWARLLAGENQEELLLRGDEAVPEMELGIALRTAWLDEAVAAFDGPQVVLLGAGLDTRPARLAREGRSFFEVDHPATQMHKRSAIAVLSGYPKETSTFVPCDFETTDFATALLSAGFDRTRPSFVIWEGVTAYLTEAAVAKTFADLVSLGASRLLFDTIGKPPKSDGAGQFAGKVGEPFIFVTDDVAPMLRTAGFKEVEQRSVREVHQARMGKDPGKAPFFDRWYFVDARR